MVNYKNFSIEDLFTPTRGKSKYTREYADNNGGKYPVYSASLTAPLCYVNEYDYEGIYLTWTTNGYGGRIQIISGKFCINGDRGILIPKVAVIPNLEYIKRFLEPILIEQAVGRIVDGKKNEYTKVSPEIVSQSIITFPINDDRTIDYKLIAETSNRIEKLENLQKNLLRQLEQIENIEINIDFDGKCTCLFLGDKDYFDLSIGERILKKDGLTEGVPVYSANVNYPFTYIEKSNISNFINPSIIWGIDGIFTWNIIPENIEFATTDHCGRLQIISSKIDPEYVYYYLQATKLEYGFDRVFRANLENISQLVEIKLPIDSEGSICIETQKTIAMRYKNIHAVRDKIIDKLNLLSNTKIEVIA